MGATDPAVAQAQRDSMQWAFDKQNPALTKGPPDAADDAVRNARIMERRRQLGLQGRMSTFLTTAQGDQAPAQSSSPTKTLLGG